MAKNTVILIILSGIIALGIAAYQYFFKAKNRNKYNYIFFLLRFVTIFAVLLLIINPTFKNRSYTTVKPVLALAVDNSSSIENLDFTEKVKNSLNILQNSRLSDRFDIDLYSFGERTSALDSLTFDQGQSNIAQVFQTFNDVYKSSTYVPVLITDGNSNIGADYAYVADELSTPIYFLAAGDTTSYDDLSIDRINVNRYAYLKNEFPVEVLSSYEGSQSVETQFLIKLSGRIVHREKVNFGPEIRSHIFKTFLPASAIGVQQYTAELSPVNTEKNTVNNAKNFAVDVIDQNTKILIAYSVLHPDLGALKKSIESNQLRKVDLLKTPIDASVINEYDFVILYQPDSTYKNVFAELQKLEKNSFIITGPETDLAFLNQNQTSFSQNAIEESDEAQPLLNSNFSAFLLDDIGFSDFPPLNANFGDISLKSLNEIALFQNINGVNTSKPLLALGEENGVRHIALFGSGIWKWRAKNYVDTKSFEGFDNFIDKLVQYGASKEKRSRLQINYESFYYGGNQITLQAQLFDKNYVFDNRGSLYIKIENIESKQTYEAPFLVKGNRFEVNLRNLVPGKYQFTVYANNEPLNKSGSFTIVDYNVENQNFNADWKKLKRIAQETGGSAFTIGSEPELIATLMNDDRYIPVQKSSEKTVPLIDFKILLFIIAASLAAEWFIRKYNGLI